MLQSISNFPNKRNINFGQSGFSTFRLFKHVDAPRCGLDYEPGDILFTQDHCLKAKLIYYFTRWSRKSGVKVAHAAIITDKDYCVEAIEGGLKRTELKKYFNNDKYTIFIRRPKDMTKEMIDKLVKSEEKDVDKTKYAYGLLIMSALRGTLLGHLIDKRTNFKVFDNLFARINKENCFLCSQDVANRFKMFENWTWRNQKILERPSAGINQQELFEADELFTPTIVQTGKRKGNIQNAKMDTKPTLVSTKY